jgi:ribosomal-protein-alanine N-acetyltransferase
MAGSSMEPTRTQFTVLPESARAMRPIECARVTLEPQPAAHAEEMFGVLSDPAIYTYENSPPPTLEWLRVRFARLESRHSGDGTEQWLNWVVRQRSSGLIGYVQATVMPNGTALIAYEFSSAHWGRGLAREAAEALIRELVEYYQVTALIAIAKGANARSLRLLERLRFMPAPPDLVAAHRLEPGEVLVARAASVAL